jgi:hypothetical protein
MRGSPVLSRSSTVLLALVLPLAFASPIQARPGRKASEAAASATVKVTLVSDGAEVFLETKRESGDRVPEMPLEPGKWDAVCVPPCDRLLPRAALLRATGLGVVASPEFHLPADRDQVTVNVKAGSATWYWTGVVMSAFGGSFVLGGAGPPLLSGGSFSLTEQILSGVGVAMLAVGLPLWILNRTTVSIR